MKPAAILITRFALLLSALSTLLAPHVANAVPLYARQTGLACTACHFGGNFPELTKTGREFKLSGYTAGSRQTIPLAGMLMISDTKIANYNGTGNSAANYPRDGDVVAQQFSLFTGGKITDNIGAFVQWTSGLQTDVNGSGNVTRHGHIDNTDIRYADKAKISGNDLAYGLTFNNNPTVQDIFNSSPAWWFPSAVPGLSFQGYGTQPMLNGSLAQQVAGLGAYVDYNDFLYAELSGYKTADGGLSFMRAGADTVGNRFPLSGTNPYWRLALHGDSGPHSWEVGTYGMVADMYSDHTTMDSPTNRFKDYALDGQYQYAHGKHRMSVTANWTHEKISYDPSLVTVNAANSSNTLDSIWLKGSYTYNNKVTGTLGWFSNTGSSDAIVYAANTNTAPDTKGYILEVDYLPIDKVKLAIQYTGYTRFNGSSTNYDGTGRNASDNNTWYLLGWIMF